MEKVQIIQEIATVPEDISGDVISWIANFIDNEVKNKRNWVDNEVIKVDSVSIVYGDDKFQFPPAHSGEEFRGFVKRLELFSRLK